MAPNRPYQLTGFNANPLGTRAGETYVRQVHGNLTVSAPDVGKLGVMTGEMHVANLQLSPPSVGNTVLFVDFTDTTSCKIGLPPVGNNTTVSMTVLTSSLSITVAEGQSTVVYYLKCTVPQAIAPKLRVVQQSGLNTYPASLQKYQFLNSYG